MEESAYLKLVDQTFRRIEDAFEDVDPDDAEVSSGGDTLTIAFKSGVRCILSRQRPTRQIWVAARALAWHFSWDGERWMDDKGRGVELFAQLAAIARAEAGLDLKL